MPLSNRNQVACRLVQLQRRLAGERYMPDGATLAHELGVSLRTLWRYVDALDRAGWPVPKRWYAHREEAA